MRAVSHVAGFARTLLQRLGEPGWFLIVLAVFLVQEFGISQLGHDGGQAMLRRAIFFATTSVAVLLAYHFRRYIGAWIIAAGIVMNVIPIIAHGGLMPVAWETIRDSGEFPQITEQDIGGQVANSKDVILWREDIRFEPLSDRFLLMVPGYGANIFSAGDFVVFGGVLLAVAQAAVFVLRPNTRTTDQDSREAAAAR
ncbi:MAG: DUF5317 family protein [Dehalococcoidia bacterium]|nr:DUF5317 family protein [Dehalococcoidia bacterium]